MNKKSKLLLTSVGLAVLSGIAATGSTFAWFTTVRTATISYGTAKVTSTNSNLSLTYIGDGGLGLTGPNKGLPIAGNKLELAGVDKLITDISGNGVSFVKPIWSSVEGVASSINEITSAIDHYVEIIVQVSNDGTNDLNLYLGAGTKLESDNTDALAAARLAVVTGTTVDVNGIATGGDRQIIYADSDEEHIYLSESSETEKVVFAPAGSGSAVNAAKSSISTVTGDLVTYNTITAAAETTLIGTVADGSPLNVTFRVWLEGEAATAIDNAKDGVISFVVDLYALEVVA